MGKLVNQLYIRFVLWLKIRFRLLVRRQISIRSIRDFSIPRKNILVSYESNILGLSGSEYCGVFEISDVIVHSRSGFVFRERKSFGMTLLEESSKEHTESIAFSNSTIYTKDLLNFEVGRTEIVEYDVPSVLFFPAKLTSNFANFLWLDLCPLLLLINNGYKRNIQIIRSPDLKPSQLEYLQLIEEVYGIRSIVAPKKSHFRLKSRLIVLEPPYKKLFRAFEFDDRMVISSVMSEAHPHSVITNEVDYFQDINKVGSEPPSNWDILDKDKVWGTFQNVKKLISTTAVESVQPFVESLVPSVVFDKPENNIVYVSREESRSQRSGNLRYVENEKEIIEKFPEIKVVSWEKLSQREKIITAYNASVLIGLHGAGLAAAHFMRQHSVVIEIHPRYFRYPSFHLSFKLMCEMSGLTHIGVLSSPLADNWHGGTRVDINSLRDAIVLAEQRLSGIPHFR